MADLREKLPGNVDGRYYVDASCIDCDQCRAMLPGFFGRDADAGVALVIRQPAGGTEIADFEEAMKSCATGSIGADGA